MFGLGIRARIELLRDTGKRELSCFVRSEMSVRHKCYQTGCEGLKGKGDRPRTLEKGAAEFLFRAFYPGVHALLKMLTDPRERMRGSIRILPDSRSERCFCAPVRGPRSPRRDD